MLCSLFSNAMCIYLGVEAYWWINGLMLCTSSLSVLYRFINTKGRVAVRFSICKKGLIDCNDNSERVDVAKDISVTYVLSGEVMTDIINLECGNVYIGGNNDIIVTEKKITKVIPKEQVTGINIDNHKQFRKNG